MPGSYCIALLQVLGNNSGLAAYAGPGTTLSPADDDVIIGHTGDVYNAHTGERLGSLTDSSLGKER